MVEEEGRLQWLNDQPRPQCHAISRCDLRVLDPADFLSFFIKPPLGARQPPPQVGRGGNLLSLPVRDVTLCAKRHQPGGAATPERVSWTTSWTLSRVQDLRAIQCPMPGLGSQLPPPATPSALLIRAERCHLREFPTHSRDSSWSVLGQAKTDRSPSTGGLLC